MAYPYITSIEDLSTDEINARIATLTAELAQVEAGEETRPDMDAELAAIFPLADHAATLRAKIAIARDELTRRA